MGGGGSRGGGGGEGSFGKDRFHRPPEFVRFVPVLFYLHRNRKDIRLFFHKLVEESYAAGVRSDLVIIVSRYTTALSEVTGPPTPFYFRREVTLLACSALMMMKSNQCTLMSAGERSEGLTFSSLSLSHAHMTRTHACTHTRTHIHTD